MHTFLCRSFAGMPVSLNFPGGLGLGTMWGIPQALRLLNEWGLVGVKLVDVPEDKHNAFYVWQKQSVGHPEQSANM